eukprot:4607983-Alexandrium_andersonii.AAC.1
MCIRDRSESARKRPKQRPNVHGTSLYCPKLLRAGPSSLESAWSTYWWFVVGGLGPPRRGEALCW